MFLDWGYIFFWVGGLVFVGGALIYGMLSRSQHDPETTKAPPPPPPTATAPNITRRAIK